MEIVFFLGIAIAAFLFTKRSMAQTPPSGGSSFTDVPEGTSGREFVQTIPAQLNDAREAALVKALLEGNSTIPNFVPVDYTKGGHQVRIFAAVDALMVGTSDPIRVNLRHLSAQVVAEALGCVLPTTRMADMAFLAAKKIAKQNQTPDSHMSDTSRMVQHSDAVAKARAAAGAGPTDLVRDLGKDWVTTEQLMQPNGAPAEVRLEGGGTIPGSIAAANFGWHEQGASQRSPGGQSVIQSIGLRHGLPHTDYSQVVTLYLDKVEIDGTEMRVTDALLDPNFAFLLSDEVPEGVAARVTRHPAAPLMAA